MCAQAGYYVTQPKDAGGGRGFSRAAVDQTAQVFRGLVQEHGCSAVLGLDFGGDVALTEPEAEDAPHLRQRAHVLRRLSRLSGAAFQTCRQQSYEPKRFRLGRTVSVPILLSW